MQGNSKNLLTTDSAVRRFSDYNCLSREVPMVPSGISTPKLSAMVQPILANVSPGSSRFPPAMEGEYTSSGTFSLVWSVPV